MEFSFVKDCVIVAVVVFLLAFGNGVVVSSDYTAAFFSESYPGRLGINNPSPTEALDVNGNAAVSGNVKIGDFLKLTPLPALPPPAGYEEGTVIVADDGTGHHHIYCLLDGIWKPLDY